MSPKLRNSFVVLFIFSLALLQSAAAQSIIVTRTYRFIFQTSPEGGEASHPEFIFSLPGDIIPVDLSLNASFDPSTLEFRIKGPDVIAPGDSWDQEFSLQGEADALDGLEDAPLEFTWKDDFFAGNGIIDLKGLAIRIPPTIELPEAISGVAKQVVRVVEDLRANPQVVSAVKDVGVPVSVTLGAVGVGVLTTTATTSSAPFAYNVIQLFRFLALGFLRFRRPKPWGRVYSSLTGNPIVGASVKILDAQFKKVRESQTTDKDGRFGFLVSPGAYYLKISKKGFAETETELLRVSDPKLAVNLEVSLEPEAEELSVKSLKFLRTMNSLKNFFDALNPYLFVFGTALSTFVSVIVPNTFNYSILGLYVALDALKLILYKAGLKSFGVVADKASGGPVSLTVVRVFDEKKSWLLGTRVTDDLGRFNFLLTRGSYYVTCMKTGYKFYQSNPVKLSRSGIIAFDVKMERLK